MALLMRNRKQGYGKRIRKEKQDEEQAFLDPIKFRYREEAVVDEPAIPAEEQAKPSRNRRNHRKPRPEGSATKADAPTPKVEAPALKAEPQPEVPAEEGAQTKKTYHRRRNYHHRRKPKAPGAEG